MAKHLPLRSCLGCGVQKPKMELLRIVQTPSGEVCFDPTGKEKGRGFYICPTADCLERMLKNKKWQKKFTISINEETLEQLRRVIAGRKEMES